MTSAIMVALACSVVWGISPLLAQHFVRLQDVSIEMLMLWSAFIWFVVVLCFTLGWKGWHSTRQEAMRFVHVVPMGWYVTWVISVYAVAAYGYYRLLQSHPSFWVMALISTAPLVTLVASMVLQKQTIHVVHILGVCLIVVGIACLQFRLSV